MPPLPPAESALSVLEAGSRVGHPESHSHYRFLIESSRPASAPDDLLQIYKRRRESHVAQVSSRQYQHISTESRRPVSAPSVLIARSTSSHRKRRSEDTETSRTAKRRRESHATQDPFRVQAWYSKCTDDAAKFLERKSRLVVIPNYARCPAIIVSHQLATSIRTAICASRKFAVLKDEEENRAEKIGADQGKICLRVQEIEDLLDEPHARLMKDGHGALTAEEWSYVQPLFDERKELTNQKEVLDTELSDRARSGQKALDLWKEHLQIIQDSLEDVWVDAGIIESYEEFVNNARPAPRDQSEVAESPVKSSAQASITRFTERVSEKKSLVATEKPDKVFSENNPPPRVSLHVYRAELISRGEDFYMARDRFDMWQNSYRREYEEYVKEKARPDDDLREEFGHHYIRETSKLAHQLDLAEKAYEEARQKAWDVGVDDANSDGGLGPRDYGYEDADKLGNALIDSCDRDYISTWIENVPDTVDDPNPEPSEPWSEPLVGRCVEIAARPLSAEDQELNNGKETVELEEILEFPALLASGRHRKRIDAYVKEWRQGRY